MKKKELTTGMLVELRDGSKCKVHLFPHRDSGLIIDQKDNGYLLLDSYTDDLIHLDLINDCDPEANCKYDIIRVYTNEVGTLWRIGDKEDLRT